MVATMPFPFLAELLRRSQRDTQPDAMLELVARCDELAERVATLEKQAAEYPAFCAMLQEQWDQYEEKLARIAERYRRERLRITQERLKEAGEGEGLAPDPIVSQRGAQRDPRQLEFPVEHMTKDQLRRLARERAMQRVPQASGE